LPRLNEQPDHLLAERYLKSYFKPDAPLVVNPECVFTESGELPVECSGAPWLFSNFDLDGTLIWIKYPGPGAALPFWLGQELADVLSSVKSGEPTPEIPAQMRSVLRMVGVLVPRTTTMKCAADGRRRRSPFISGAVSLAIVEKFYPAVASDKNIFWL
jgi:hypothetical protein